MANPTNYSNALLASNTHTFTGPAVITGIKVVAGVDAATCTLTSARSGTPVVYKSGSVAAGAGQFDNDIDLVIPSGDIITVSTTGTSPSIFIYLG